MKRLISVLLVVSMIFVLFSAKGFISYGSTTNAMEKTGQTADEPKSIWGKYETVSVNQIPEISSELIETVEIKNAGECCYYKFTPTESGAYKYYSDSTESIYGAIRNFEFKTAAIGNNYETYPFYPYYPVLRGDFGIISMFEAGETYYLESYIDNNGTGTYNIGLVKVPKATAVDISYIGYREYGSEITFSAKYTPVDCAPESIASWTSSNSAVVEIDNSGNAFCKGVGTAVITVTTKSGLSATKEIVVEDCDEIKTSEKETYTVLFESNYRYKFVPEVSGVYTFSFDRDNWVFFMAASLKDAQLEKIVSVNNEDDKFDCTLTAGETYYLEIDANSGDVMCWASVTAELKEEIVEVTTQPTEIPVVTGTPVPTETEIPEPTETPTPEPTITICPTETPTPEVTITPTPTCIYPTDTPEPIKTPTPEPTETIKPTEEIVETVCPWAPTGDVNIDDKINAEDALLVLKHAAKMVTLTGQNLEAADTNDDDSIDAKDALEILKYAAKIE